jgi:hypothetical protein
MTHRSSLLSILIVTFLAAPALAQSEDTPEARLAERDGPYLRLEATMGFVAGYGRYSEVGLTGTVPVPEATFDGGPFAGGPLAGVRYDVRLVVAFVRMTIGGDLLWGIFDGGHARTLDEGGMPITIADRRLFDGALRFGLGLEATVDGVRLFADVLGTIHFVEASLERQGDPIGHSAVAFSPGLRLGVRIPVVDGFFVQLSADGSPFGPSWLGGDFSVGGAIE